MKNPFVTKRKVPNIERMAVICMRHASAFKAREAYAESQRNLKIAKKLAQYGIAMYGLRAFHDYCRMAVYCESVISERVRMTKGRKDIISAYGNLRIATIDFLDEVYHGDV